MRLPAQSKPPEYIPCITPEEIDWYDPMGAIAQTKLHGRSYLLVVSNPGGWLPPAAGTDTETRHSSMSFLVQRFLKNEDTRGPRSSDSGMCNPCNTRANLEHLICRDRPLCSRPRQRAIASLALEWRPSSFETWALTGHSTAAAANELSR
ncbi:hypothetical protein HPB50_010043 [Hyalomma asiaticum]|uniref:Uncharacterized protein n=1 Tax=Hyalomma asiaticum TaxID=266040 RepID=A0ACB7S1K9_HYAAI|nr:hypothetical protein HPB50_010043 [Hyalomma asiaticum]